MSELKTKGLFEDQESLIDKVWVLESKGTPTNLITRMCGIEKPVIDKIMNNFEPRDDAKIEILEYKISEGQKNGHDIESNLKEKEKLEDKILNSDINSLILSKKDKPIKNKKNRFNF